MDEELEALIRRRAHELWEQDGKPLERSISYWLAAEREIVGIVPEDLADRKPRADTTGDEAGQTSIASAFAPGLTPSDPRHN